MGIRRGWHVCLSHCLWTGPRAIGLIGNLAIYLWALSNMLALDLTSPCHSRTVSVKANTTKWKTMTSYDHVPMTRSQHICNCKYTCQRVLCLLTWRYQQRVASHCFGKLLLWWRNRPDSANVYGPFGEHLADRKNRSQLRVIMTSGVSAGAIFVLLAEHGLRKPPIGCISRDIHGWQLVIWPYLQGVPSYGPLKYAWPFRFDRFDLSRSI